jgi:hypothetical protein
LPGAASTGAVPGRDDEQRAQRPVAPKPRPPPTSQELVQRIDALRARLEKGETPNRAIVTLLERLSLQAASADSVEQRAAIEQKVLHAEKRYGAP